MSTRRAVLKVNRMISVQVRPGWNTERIARPESKCRVVWRNSEGVRVLSQSIDVGLCRDTSLDPNVLWLEDDWMRDCRKQNLSCGLPEDGERKRGCRIVEPNGRRLRGGIAAIAVVVRSRQHGLRDFIAGRRGVSYLQMDPFAF